MKVLILCLAVASLSKAHEPWPSYDQAPPAAWDWRDTGFVPEVRDQGAIGSASILAAVDAAAINLASTIRGLVVLSHQQVIDCIGSANPQPLDVITYIQANGLQSIADYPIRTNGSGPCNYNKTLVAGWSSFGINSTAVQENTLLNRTYYWGASVVTLSVDQGLINYTGGIYSNESCAKATSYHPFVVVGYGQENGQDFWVLRNSWGNKWGEKGYLRLLLGKGICNIGKNVVINYMDHWPVID